MLLRPTVTKVDLYVTYPILCKRGLSYCKNKAVEHKFKTMIMMLGFAGAYKFYGFYRTLRMMFNPLGMGASEDMDQENAQLNPS